MALAALLIVAPGAAAQPAPARNEGPSPGGAALRSLVLPGWGQAANRSWIKGVAFFGAYAGFITWGVSINQDKQDAQGRLHAAESDSAQAYWSGEVARLRDSRNGKYWLAGLTVLLAVADAYVDAHLKNFDDRMDADVGLIPVGDHSALGLRVTLPVGEALPPARRRDGVQ